MAYTSDDFWAQYDAMQKTNTAAPQTYNNNSFWAQPGTLAKATTVPNAVVPTTVAPAIRQPTTGSIGANPNLTDDQKILAIRAKLAGTTPAQFNAPGAIQVYDNKTQTNAFVPQQNVAQSVQSGDNRYSQWQTVNPSTSLPSTPTNYTPTNNTPTQQKQQGTAQLQDPSTSLFTWALQERARRQAAAAKAQGASQGQGLNNQQMALFGYLSTLLSGTGRSQQPYLDSISPQIQNSVDLASIIQQLQGIGVR